MPKLISFAGNLKHSLPFPKLARVFTCLQYTFFFFFSEHYGKKKKMHVASNFSFPTVFTTRLKNFLPFSSNLKLSFTNFLRLKESKICRLGEKLNLSCHSLPWIYFVESVNQDQPAHTCSLILPCTLRYSVITLCQRKSIQCHENN